MIKTMLYQQQQHQNKVLVIVLACKGKFIKLKVTITTLKSLFLPKFVKLKETNPLKTLKPELTVFFLHKI
jgi:hypothetical protein